MSFTSILRRIANLSPSRPSRSGRSDADILPAHSYPEQFSPDMDLPFRPWADRFYLIASTQRSGSHYLGHMLLETKACGVPLEYMNSGNSRYWSKRFGTRNIEELFPKFVQHRTSPNGTFCFKAHWSQYKRFSDRIDTLTRGYGLKKVIFLTRRDKLSQAISFVIASRTGSWIGGVRESDDLQDYYDYNEITKRAKQIQDQNLAWQDYLSRYAADRCLHIIYEDLVSDPSVRDRVSDFLDIETPLAPSKRTVRQKTEINKTWRKRFMYEIRKNDQWIIKSDE